MMNKLRWWKRKEKGTTMQQTLGNSSHDAIRRAIFWAERDAGVNPSRDLWDDSEKCTVTKFINYHTKNPHVYSAFVEQARVLKRHTSLQQTGIDFIHARVRWMSYLRIDTDDPFKMSNDYRPLYARLIQHLEPDLKGFFNLHARFKA